MGSFAILLAAATAFVPNVPHGCSVFGEPEMDACGTPMSAAVIAKFSNQISFRGKDLVVSPTKGSERVFAYSEAEGSFSSAKPLFVIEPFRLALIYEWEWEGRDVFLVSLDTGALTNLRGWPLLSPDGKRILVYSEAIESNFYANVVAIYRLQKSEPVLELVLNGDESPGSSWGPTSPAWDNATEFHFTKEWWSGGSDREKAGKRYRLIQGKWTEIEQPNQPLHPDASRASALSAGERRR